MGAMGRGWSWWTWFIIWIHIIYTWIVWWFSFLPAVGQLAHSGATDPTVIKILILVGAVLCFVLLVVAFFFGLGWSRQSLRQNAGLWHFLLCFFILLGPLTVWAWLWDDRKAVLFDDGVPVWPVFPQPCNEECRAANAAQQLAFMEWEVILIFSVVFHSFILASVIHGWRMELIGTSMRVTPTGTASRSVASKRKSGPTELVDTAALLVGEGNSRTRR